MTKLNAEKKNYLHYYLNMDECEYALKACDEFHGVEDFVKKLGFVVVIDDDEKEMMAAVVKMVEVIAWVVVVVVTDVDELDDLVYLDDTCYTDELNDDDGDDATGS